MGFYASASFDGAIEGWWELQGKIRLTAQYQGSS
jgi:hypothetical protein